MLHFWKLVLGSVFTISLVACSTSSNNQTDSTPTTSSSASPSLNTASIPFIKISETNFLKNNTPGGVVITGLSGIENNSKNTWRWALGPETKLAFKMPKAQPLSLVFTFESPINNQDVIVQVNSSTVDSIKNLQLNQPITRNIKFQSTVGLNTVVFKYKSWNQNQVKFAPLDPRPMAVSFAQLAIQ